MSKSMVAVVTEQATDSLGLVAVVDMEPAVSTGVCRAANRAAVVLQSKKTVVISGSKSVILLKAVISKPIRVFKSPCSREGSGFRQISFSPLTVPLARTNLAPLLQVVERPDAAKKVGGSFNFFASLASLLTRQVNALWRSGLEHPLLRKRAHLTIGRQQIELGSVFVELGFKFFGSTCGTSLHGSSPYCIPTVVNAFHPVNRG